MRESILLALRAPGSIEAAVGKVQQALFQEHGFVSAIALSPVIPIAFLGRAPDSAHEETSGIGHRSSPRGFLQRLQAAVSGPLMFSAAGMAWQQGALFLALDTGGVWASLRDACAGESTTGLFPVAEGFFLGCIEATAPGRTTIRIEASLPSFSSASIAVIGIATPARAAGKWWRDVSCTIDEERPLRGKR